jgi:hypothetical protein
MYVYYKDMSRTRFIYTQFLFALITTIVIVNFHDVMDSKSIFKSVVIFFTIVIIQLTLKLKVIQNLIGKFGI